MVKKFNRSSRAEDIMEYIEDHILNGRWQSGERVDDSALSEELGVSRNSVREAMARLTSLRALEKRQWAGYFIPVITWEEAKHTIDIRLDLEILALKLFMEQVSPEVIEEIEESIRKSERDLEKGDFHSFIKSDYVIHEIVHRHTGNPWIPHFMKQTRFAIDRLRLIDKIRDFEKIANSSISDHWRMIEAIKRNDIAGAIESMKSQIDQHWKRLNELFENKENT